MRAAVEPPPLFQSDLLFEAHGSTLRYLNRIDRMGPVTRQRAQGPGVVSILAGDER
jgi:hypothetical protein